LKPLEVSALEKKLVANENDIETRIKLIRHYADESSKKPALQALHVRHRIWLIKNRPLLDDDAVYGWSFHTLTDSSREQLKAAWLEQVEGRETFSDHSAQRRLIPAVSLSRNRREALRRRCETRSIKLHISASLDRSRDQSDGARNGRREKTGYR
jgi:hypothetical protein